MGEYLQSPGQAEVGQHWQVATFEASVGHMKEGPRLQCAVLELDVRLGLSTT